MVVSFLEHEIPAGEKLSRKVWQESPVGDAKAENVLVDQYGNAWIIDFSGGYTDGWVEENVKETKAGDLQGLQQIKKFLGILNSET
ncbi:hypothetical protein AJ80_09642 [Polytolypa hystricis UAMH7299]|uniref:Protein kinase domain-containing protein n=1 Tax=Polytolypa hystricis (strain UAMH7299) TaxID=1447883 RepID=A0A2B7WM14_POLH7|nr:hypothetical protein AJ80_09642 [Polytolypa hystricis UAMH7299]